jgi:hypothetical protein
VLALALTVHACAFLRSTDYSVSPLFTANGRLGAHYQALVREQDQLINTCAETRTCDRAHYTRALLALYENQAVAAKHFQEVIDAAPKSHLASSSLFWLEFLQNPQTFLAWQGLYAEAADHLVRDLLELESSSSQVMQREVKVRDKKVEELTTQLEALKRIDQEMKEMTRPVKPPLKTPLPSDKGVQP